MDILEKGDIKKVLNDERKTPDEKICKIIYEVIEND